MSEGTHYPERGPRQIGRVLITGDSGSVLDREPIREMRSRLETDHQLLPNCRKDVLGKASGACKGDKLAEIDDQGNQVGEDGNEHTR
jgi:hypothetical protein